jgi:HB1, ASXL, restriction endonuclease HTH domain
MSNLSWRDAITKVLQGSTEAMHYTEIAEAIAQQQLRSDFGATPAATVNSIISVSLQEEGTNSPFIRVDRGRYWLRQLAQISPSQSAQPLQPIQPESATADDTGLINAFGMYWSRNNVLWTPAPRILGQQQPGSTAVDFCGQRGVYLLHDGHTVVYVGRTTEQPLGVRLRQHIVDRLNGRWDRFSWFGIYPVAEDASLNTASAINYSISMLIVTMEALLIEGLEPPQNRKRGDDFRAIEFLQVEDPEMQKTQILKLMDELKNKL